MFKRKYSQPTKKYYGKNIYDSFSIKIQFSYHLIRRGDSHFYLIFSCYRIIFILPSCENQKRYAKAISLVFMHGTFNV